MTGVWSLPANLMVGVVVTVFTVLIERVLKRITTKFLKVYHTNLNSLFDVDLICQLKMERQETSRQ